jgi:hypothetical protein
MTKTIQASGLTTFEVAPDGEDIALNVVELDGTAASLRMPFACLTQLLMTLPDIQTRALRARHQDPTLRVAYPVGPWTLEASNDPAKFILTLTTEDGFKASFALPTQDIIDMGQTASRTLSDISAAALPH